MTSFIQPVVSNYDEVLKNIRDPVVDTWPLMKSPSPVLCIIGVYLMFVLKVGPKLMEKRPAFQLKNLMILYNAVQVFLSIWLINLILQVDLKYVFSLDGHNIQNSLILENRQITIMSRGAWWYFFLKVTELLDTVFFVLRKKQNQISFLHVYHHTLTVISSWCYLKFLPGEQGILIGLLNTTVHVIMYSYYLIAALGPKYKKYIWWKKYLTSIQLVQFTLMLIYLLYLLIMDSQTPKVLTYFFIIVMIIFIYLFSDFYRQTYKKKVI